MTTNPDNLRRLADETKQRHGATHGYVCTPRLTILHQALYGAACVLEQRRRGYLLTVRLRVLLGALLMLSGVGIGAIIFTI